MVIASNLFDMFEKSALLGAPREGDNGEVIAFILSDDEDLGVGTIHEPRFRGDQFGSAFGHSIATVPIDLTRAK